jgi:hypothetical protein
MAEGTTLASNLNSLLNPDTLETLVAQTSTIIVKVFRSDEEQEVEVSNLAPYHTIEDIQRAVWVQEETPADLYPKYTFFAIQEDDGSFTPATFLWYETSKADQPVHLPDPRTVISSGTILDTFVDAAGTKKPVGLTTRNRVTLQDAFLRHGEMPTFYLFSYSYLRRKYAGTGNARDWFGLFYPYFPALAEFQSSELTAADTTFGNEVKLYIDEKRKQVQILEEVLGFLGSKSLKSADARYISLKWIQPVPAFEGTDLLFYEAPVSPGRPYMRLLPPSGTPLTKLYQPSPLEPPAVSDPVLLRTWVQDRAPLVDQSCLFAKLVVRAPRIGIPPIYGTLLVLDDATAEFILQPAKDRRVLDVQADLSSIATVLQEGTIDMPFSAGSAQLHKANISVEVEFEQVPPKDIRKQVQQRLEALSTIFQQTEVPEGMQAPLFMIKFKGVSNFAQEDSITSFLNFHFSRKGLEGIRTLVPLVSKEFELSEDQAAEAIEKYITDKTDQTVADPETKEFVPTTPTAPSIAITSSGIKTFKFQLYDVDSFEMFIQLCTILNAVITGDEELWAEQLGTARPAMAVTSALATVEEKQVKDEEQIQQKTNAVEVDEPNIDTFNSIGDFIEDEVEGLPAAPAPQVQVQAAAPEPVNEGPQQKIVAHEWFIRRLKRLDPVLFDFKLKNPGDKHYTSQCAANEDRHPVVLTTAEYQRVRKLYEEDEKAGKVGFIEYGTPNTKKTINEARGKTEQITVLRYGSSLQKAAWYLCSEYFCLYDLVPLLKEEFEATKHCRFCKGIEITNKLNPGPNERVFHRKIKPQSKKRHLFVQFLRSGKHPESFELPCCFVSRKDIDWSDQAFTRLREPLTQTDVYTSEVAESAAASAAATTDILAGRAQQIVAFEPLRRQLSTQYVVGPEKYPLDPGKIGLPNLALDQYLGQNAAQMVERRAIMQTFKPTVHGFFRIGVLNKAVLGNQSLFAALAPILGKNTSKDVEEFFLAAITPRIFVSLNFGNLVLEFFNPNDTVPPQTELDTWAQTHLQINKTGTELEISRVWRAYHRFRAYISDPSQKKQLRHFVHALAEPNLLTKQGITLLTITYDQNPREPTSTLHVSCPLMGYDFDRYASNTVGFLTYFPPSGIWEPLLYVDSIKEVDMLTTKLEGYYRLSQGQLLSTSFPSVVRQRYLEFLTQCRSAYRGAFTYQSGIDPRILIPSSRMIEILKGLKISGFVRDAYNHLIAITVRPKGSRVQEVLIPVADDGNTFLNAVDVHIHLGLQSVEFAGADDVEKVYSEIASLLTPLSSIYQLSSFVKTNQIVAFQLGTEESPERILLPCGPADEGKLRVPIMQISATESFQFEYQINRELIIDKDDTEYPESEFILEKRLADDIFQHFRLSFSNWISTAEGGSARAFVEKLLERKDLPNFEKFRRLEIQLGGILEAWLAPDEGEFILEPVLLRKDCRAETNPEKCTGFCTMSEGQCKLHVPAKLQFNSSSTIPIRRYLVLKLFDEILRLPAKRHQLMTKGVRRIQIPSRNIHIGDQWILPETAPAWYELLKEDAQSAFEQPKYYEEYSRQTESKEEEEARLQKLHFVALPPHMQTLLTDEGKKRLAVRIVGTPGEDHTGPLLEFFGFTKQSSDSNDILSAARLVEISRKQGIAVVQVLVQRPDILPIGRTPEKYDKKVGSIVIIPDMPEGPGVLVLIDTGGTSIPIEYLQPALTDTIEYKKAAPRIIRRTAPSVTATVVDAAGAEELKYDSNDTKDIVEPVKPRKWVRTAAPARALEGPEVEAPIPIVEAPAEAPAEATEVTKKPRWVLKRPIKEPTEAPAPPKPQVVRIRSTKPV